MRPSSLVLFVGIFLLFLNSCGSFPFYTSANEPLPNDGKFNKSDFIAPISPEELKEEHNGLFIGIALSGGGSRAANFSAALLFELQELGVLPKHVSAISSVSGSSLTAAYYGLFHDQPDRWNIDVVKERLRTDFEQSWLLRLLLPHNIFRYSLTNFDRSDVMKGVFDDVLFDEKVFGNFAKSGPRILINATNIGPYYAQRFVFSDDKFRSLGSNLNSYPISHAVMASGAFPGVFHNVTLKDYSAPDPNIYYHIYDGRPFDNLGIETLREEVRRLLNNSSGRGGSLASVRGCFIFVVDAHTETFLNKSPSSLKGDTREFIDFFIDRNAIHASDQMLRYRTNDTLKNIGIDNPWSKPYGKFRVTENEPLECSVSVFNFERIRFLRDFPIKTPMPRSEPLTDELAELDLNTYGIEYYNNFERVNACRNLSSMLLVVHQMANRISTRYFLTHSWDSTISEDLLQEVLFRAAEILVWKDSDNLQFICDWFTKHGEPLPPCSERKTDDVLARKYGIRNDICEKDLPIQ